jgi:hypothetical protein
MYVRGGLRIGAVDEEVLEAARSVGRWNDGDESDSTICVLFCWSEDLISSALVFSGFSAYFILSGILASLVEGLTVFCSDCAWPSVVAC